MESIDISSRMSKGDILDGQSKRSFDSPNPHPIWWPVLSASFSSNFLPGTFHQSYPSFPPPRRLDPPLSLRCENPYVHHRPSAPTDYDHTPPSQTQLSKPPQPVDLTLLSVHPRLILDSEPPVATATHDTRIVELEQRHAVVVRS